MARSVSIRPEPKAKVENKESENEGEFRHIEPSVAVVAGQPRHLPSKPKLQALMRAKPTRTGVEDAINTI